MNSPILSICIPTFNRAECLEFCLKSITDQFVSEDIINNVEIVISDNCSTDNTKLIVEKFLNKYRNIKYSKNSINEGFDKNILKVVSLAQGKYCWFLGDDDALFKDSLTNILPILTSEKFGYLLANCWGYNKEMTEKVLSKPNLDIPNSLEYNSLSEFVKSIKDYNQLIGNFGGISQQIFKRSVWIDFPNKEQYIGTLTIHLFVILSAFKNESSCVVAVPLVKTRSDNMRWEDAVGLETIAKRARATKNGIIWILDLYKIPYSRFKIELHYLVSLGYSYLFNFSKKTIFRNKKVRSFIKKIIGL